MSLTKYKKKRNLSESHEPEGGRKSKSKSLKFVVQRHKATSLHYDFRLEMDGVLKSWAVPKGPSLNPKDKRLAMMVEDHPLDYGSFKGVIPEGHYGAGIVEIWDHGTYKDISEKNNAKAEKKLLSDLKKGSLKFILKGKKLKGEFALVKMKGDTQKNAWLLIKHKDEFAVDKKYDSENETDPESPINLALKEKSVKRKKKTSAKTADSKKKSISKSDTLTKKLKDYIKPMLAKTEDSPFSDPEWIFEIKWDGYRAIAETGKKNIRLYSRNGLSFAEKYELITEELKKQKTPAVFDGEIVVLTEKGIPDFQQLQDYKSNKTYPLYYYVFDLLFYNGKDIREKPLLERKKILKELLINSDVIRYCDHVSGKGEDFFSIAKEQNLEGIMAKKADSGYFSGKRTNHWLKIKNHQTLEAVIGGFTEPRGSRQSFGALILGVYKNKKLQYIGHTGTGFDGKTLKELHAKMKPLIQKKSPFKNKVPVNNPATWIRPVLTCNIKYTEKTADGILRHPVFQGLRIDKSAKEITWEEQIKENTSTVKRFTKKKAMKEDKTMDNKKDKTITVSRRKLTLTNLNKIFWPEEKITKGDVIEYYNTMSKFILPYLKGRPESLKRNPNGIIDKGFFHKDAGKDAPDWVDTKKIFSESTKENVEYIICNNKPTLLYLSNLGCIEFNPWNSKIGQPDHPDYCIIDIDPSAKNDYDDVVDVALAVKAVLDKARIPGYCKTSGATGMHIYIPLGAKYPYDQVRVFAEIIAHLTLEQIPEISTMERSLKKRNKNMVYIDYLQNSRGQTLACAYSLRPRPGAPVSTPLFWKEVKHGLKPESFNIHNIASRVEKKGDIFRNVLKKGIDMKRSLRTLGK